MLIELQSLLAAQPPEFLANLIDWNRVANPDQWPPSVWMGLKAFAVLVATLLAYNTLARGLRIGTKTHRLPESVAYALRKILRWIAVLVAAVLLLNVLGVFESVFTALAGVLTLVAAGFVAFWSVLSNLLCAIILLLARPFQIGDRLSFVGDPLTGTVSDFNLLFTTLMLDDGRMLQVPNNLFFQKMFIRETGRRTVDLSQSLEANRDMPPETAAVTTPAVPSENRPL